MPLDRNLLKAYADTYWYQPCQDNKAWLSNAPIDIPAQYAQWGLSPAEWAPVFLAYDPGKYIDGFFFIRRTRLATLAAIEYHADGIPPDDKIFVQNWNGLNDCAHFVSECLKAGGISVYSVAVGPVVDGLRARADTKTLAHLVEVGAADRIVNSGILRVGDVIAYGDSQTAFNVHGHSVVYMGGNAVANHTRLNHPTCTGPFGGAGNWRHYARPSTLHPMVTIIHFGHDDAPTASVPWLFGWWAVTWRGEVYFYYFDDRGRVSYTQTQPPNTAQPPASVRGKGYWFTQAGELLLCWTQTGSLERFVLPFPGAEVSMAGMWNDQPAEPLVAVKML